MDTKVLDKWYDLNIWATYRPLEPQYIKYLPNIILAALKIEDTYMQIRNARDSLTFMDVTDFGQIQYKDEKGYKHIRSKFLFDALACYNYAIDLSWQSIYLYLGENTYDILLNKEKYYKALKGCNQETVLYYLRLANKLKLYKCVKEFFVSSLTRELREAYNYLKHRGTYNVEGTGTTSTHHFPLEMEGIDLRMETRETLNLNDWKAKLISFDIEFYNYFTSVITMMMPSDFKQNNTKISDVIDMLNRIEIKGKIFPRWKLKV